MSSTKKNIVYNVSYRVFQLFIPLIVTPYLSRVLLPDGIGYFSYTNASASYFLLFVMLGISTHGVRSIAAEQRNGSDAVSRRFWSLYIGQLFASLLVIPAYLIYSFKFTEDPTSALLWVPLVLSGALDCSWFVFGCGEFRIPTIRNYIIQIATTLCVLLFVNSSQDLSIYIFISSSSSLISSFSLLPFVFSRVKGVWPSLSEVRADFKKSLFLFAPVIAISVYTSIDKVMLGSISGMSENGYYTYADKIVAVATAVLTAAGTVMLPKMSELYAAKKNKEALDLLGYSVWFMQAFAWGITFGLASVGTNLIPLFLGNSFIGATPSLVILGSRVPILAMTYVLGNQFLLPKGRDKEYTLSVFVGALIDVFLNLILLKPLGAIGASISTVVAEFSILIIQCIFLKVDLPIFSYIKTMIPFALGGFISFVITYALQLFLKSSSVNQLVILLISGFIFILIYTFLSIKLNWISNSRYIQRLMMDISFKAKSHCS